MELTAPPASIDGLELGNVTTGELATSRDIREQRNLVGLRSEDSLEPPSNKQDAADHTKPLDWDGPDDSDDPMNWSTFKKSLHVAAVAYLSFAVTAGSSIITPGIDGIAAQYHVSREAALLPVSLFVLGQAIGPAIAAPLSEVFGRSIVYKTTVPIYMLFVLGAGFSTRSFGGLLVCRLFAGVAGGPPLSIGGGTLADMFAPRFRAVPAVIYVMMPFAGPSIGPVLGGFVTYYKGWRWTQWVTILLALIAWIGVLPMHETYKKVILRRRAKARGIPQPKAISKAVLKTLITITLVRPLVFLAREPPVIFISLYNAFAFGVLYAFFAAYPYVFESVYRFNTWQYGLTFLGIGVGVVASGITAIFIDYFVYRKKFIAAMTKGLNRVEPEHRLYLAMVGSFGITIGLFWFAWTARHGVHWIVPTVAGVPFAWGNTATFSAGALYLIDTYGPMNGASALAANGILRYVFGAVFPLFTIQMYEKLGIAWATSLLAFASLALLPIPWIFFRFGPAIRRRSKYSVD